MTSTTGLLLLLFLAPPAEPARPSQPLLDGTRDTIVRRAFIPSDDRIHGELRLVRRDDAWVLQTLIYSKRLRRGVQRIEKKERYHWRPESEGYVDSLRYLEDLETAESRVLDELSSAGSGTDDPRQKMLIEFILAPSTWLYALYTVTLDESGERAEIDEKEPVVVRVASRAYIERAMRIQAEEGFDELPSELATGAGR